MTLNSDLKVGWAIPIDGVCCIRPGAPISGGLLRRSGPTGVGGAMKLDELFAGSDVTVASAPSEWWWFGVGLANVADGVEWTFTRLPPSLPAPVFIEW